jgi:hypothetical protein
MRGRVSSTDRLQRIVIGAILMGLNVLGMTTRSVHWTNVAALVVQIELLTTGVVGWCPIYWACKVGVEVKKA